MILNDQIEALGKCIFYDSGPEPLEDRFYLHDIHDCGQTDFGDAQILRGLKRNFSVHSEEICTTCTPEKPVKYCNQHPKTEAEQREYWKLNADALIQQWFEWVKSEGIFQSLEPPEELGKNHWKVTGTFESGPVRFHLFMSSNRLDTFNFDQDTPEFGIAFLNPQYVESSNNTDRTYIWSEVLREGFAQDLRQAREELLGQFGDRLLSIKELQTSQRLVENSIRGYLRNEGYSRIENNVGSNCPEARRYELDVSSHGDFVAMKSDDEKVVVCDCDNVNDYHLHRFSDSRLVAASGENGMKELDHLVNQIQLKAEQRATLNKRKEDIQNFVNLATGVAAVAAILSLFNNIGQFTSFVSGLFENAPLSEGVGYGLLSLALLSIIFIALLVGISLYWEYKFDWDISPSDSTG